MKHRLIAMTAAFLLSLTPLTAHAGAILVEPEQIDLRDYTTDCDALKKADSVMFSRRAVHDSFLSKVTGSKPDNMIPINQLDKRLSLLKH